MRSRSILARAAAGAGVAGALTLASFGVAGASTSPQATASAANCSQASTRLQKIQTAQADVQKYAGEVAGWVTETQQGGVPRLSKRFSALENRLKKASDRLSKAEQRIQTACPGSGGSSS
jgi:hypothetical protein